MVIELKNDNLIDYFGDEKVIVVFSSTTCRACKEIKPYLHKLPEEYTVVIVDSIKSMRSVRYYPTIALYLNGHFNKELKQIDIIKQNII